MPALPEFLQPYLGMSTPPVMWVSNACQEGGHETAWLRPVFQAFPISLISRVFLRKRVFAGAEAGGCQESRGAYYHS